MAGLKKGFQSQSSTEEKVVRTRVTQGSHRSVKNHRNEGSLSSKVVEESSRPSRGGGAIEPELRLGMLQDLETRREFKNLRGEGFGGFKKDLDQGGGKKLLS